MTRSAPPGRRRDRRRRRVARAGTDRTQAQGRPDAAATGTFAALGTAIEQGFRLYVAEQGRPSSAAARVESSRSTTSPDPAKAPTT
jgi:hypothetical protein